MQVRHYADERGVTYTMAGRILRDKWIERQSIHETAGAKRTRWII
jgi:hypothetical protein